MHNGNVLPADIPDEEQDADIDLLQWSSALDFDNQLPMSMREHYASLDRRTSTCCTWQSLTVLSPNAKE